LNQNRPQNAIFEGRRSLNVLTTQQYSTRTKNAICYTEVTIYDYCGTTTPFTEVSAHFCVSMECKHVRVYK